ncbi:MAG: DUF4129 domain-containing protein [Verrucomicrobiales bacterium]|nr:DUF4129 domain-containing protein [Verrucomicrobiales bacterium]
MTRPGAFDVLPSAVDLVEGGLSTLRRLPPWAWVAQLAGTIPFTVALMWFVADMSHHPRALDHVAGSSLLVAVLFMVCAAGQAVFAVELRRQLQGGEAQRWTFARWARLLIPQWALQSIAVVVLPVSLFLLLPFPLTFAWFQNLAVLGESGDGRLRATARRAWSQTRLQVAALFELMGVLALAALLLAINVAVGLLSVPLLLRTLLGVETHLSVSLALAFNATYLSVVLGITWVVLDPVVKAAFALRAFHGDSLRTGEDLLQAFPTESRAARGGGAAGALRAVLALVVCLTLGGRQAEAADDAAPVASRPAAMDLNRALDDVLARPEFAWRLPPAPVIETDVAQELPVIARIQEFLFRCGRAVRDALGKFLEWLERNLGGNRAAAPSSTPDWLAWLNSPQAIAALALLVLAGGVAWFFLKRARARAVGSVAAVSIPIQPDLTAEEVLATDLPAEDWRSLADDLVRRGETRLAIRAVYLSTLAELAARSLIAIARFKSNADYVAEFKRRPRTRSESLDGFRRLVHAFECVWYGAHPASPEAYETATREARRARE